MKRCSIFLICSFLCACSSLHHDASYLSADNGRVLVVKSPLSRSQLKTQYVLPNAQKTKAPNTAPPSFASN